MKERRLVELARLVDRLEAAAYDIIPAAIQYAMDWADPEDIERWYTAEQLGNHQADLQLLRSAIEQLTGHQPDTPRPPRRAQVVGLIGRAKASQRLDRRRRPV
jgi:hypothetical protein